MTDAVKQPDSSLVTRARSAMFLAPPVLILIFFGGGGFTIMLSAVAAIGVYEWVKMVMTGRENTPPQLVHLSAGVAALGTVTAGMVGNPVAALLFLCVLSFVVFSYNFSKNGPSLKYALIGMFYISFAAQIMIWLRNGTDHGLYNILTLLFIVWASDIAAYFSGRAIGGPKLAPSISPKKTWAGFWGSSIGAGVVAAAFACPWVLSWGKVETLGGMGVIGYFTMGFVLAMFGQAGDLLISVFKRHFGIKDTGAVIPGHGGILDRVDALILVALIFGSIAFLTGA